MTTDQEAFLKVQGRLVGDVGHVIDLLIADSRTNEAQPPPFWALLRMLLPIAESLGDLVYQEGETTENLRRIFAEELVSYSENYGKVAALLSLIYRHSLMHQDELRVIEFEGHTVVWSVGFPKDLEHLAVVVQGDRIRIQFDAQEFYDDLVRLCDELSQREFGGAAGKRYDDWTHLELQRQASGVGLKQKAVAEIDALLASVND